MTTIVNFDESELEQKIRLQNNGFRVGDIVKLKPEWRDKGEEQNFHLVQECGTNLYLSTIPKNDKEKLQFPPMVLTKRDMIEPTIYHNVEKEK